MSRQSSEYAAVLFNDAPDWSRVNRAVLSNFLWEGEKPFRPHCTFSLCAVSEQGFFVRMTAEEPSPTAVFTQRDEPVWRDSCLEFFFRPYNGDNRYINIEMNPNCAYLSAIGANRYERTFLRDVSEQSCTVKSLETGGGWGVELFVPLALISECFGREFQLESGCVIFGNAYKCADGAERPHYLSLFNVETRSPDYHRPEFFGKLIFI